MQLFIVNSVNAEGDTEAPDPFWTNNPDLTIEAFKKKMDEYKDMTDKTAQDKAFRDYVGVYGKKCADAATAKTQPTGTKEAEYTIDLIKTFDGAMFQNWCDMFPGQQVKFDPDALAQDYGNKCKNMVGWADFNPSIVVTAQ